MTGRPDDVAQSLMDRAAAPWTALLLYAAALLWTLPDFAVTWDEPGWFDFGQRAWEFSLGASDEPLRDPNVYFHYGSIPSMTAAASRWLFADQLNLLAPDLASHLSNVAWTLIGVGALITWAIPTLGARGALWTVCLWAFWIRLWPHAHNNISDIPGAATTLWACWGAWRIATAPSVRARDYVLWGLMMGIAYSTRAPNVYFVGFWIGVWGCLDQFVAQRRWPAFSWFGIAGALIVFLATVKVANPFLWQGSVFEQVFVANPLAYLNASIGDVPLWFRGQYYGVGEAPWYYAIWTFAVTTPILLLALLLPGIATVTRRFREAPPHLVLWATLGIGAIAKHLVGAGNYDGVRHFAEAFGPLTLLAAHGGLTLAGLRARAPRIRRHTIDVLVILAIALPIWRASQVYPYLTGYFNPLVGSTERAWRDYEADYWGQGFTEAAQWLEGALDMTDRTIYMPLAPRLMSRLVPDRFEVLRVTSREQLAEARSGSLWVLLNRKGFRLRRSIPACPENWRPLAEIGPQSISTPAVVICMKR